jgi:hypothetical protein
MNPITVIGLLSDGAQVLLENIKIISILSANIIGIGVWVLWGISANRANREWSKNGVALLSIGICGFVLVSYAIVAISRIWNVALPILSNGLLILSLLSLGAGLLLYVKKNLSVRFRGFIIPLAIIALIVLTRFAFLKELEYPLYYDSAVHYQIVEDLQSQSQSQSLGQIWNLNSGRYYHIGFHSTVVVLASQLRRSGNEAQLILITGHVFLIILVLNTGILASRLFNNFYAGILTVIFAGLGWSMPAYAINWGKYPAISSLAIFPLAAYWMIDVSNSTDKNRRLYILLYGISALCAVLLHSRSLVLLGCGAAAITTLKMVWKRLSNDNIFALFWAEIVLILLIVQIHPNFQAALLPYLKRIDLISTLVAVTSIFFVASQNTKVALGILTFTMYLAIISTIRTPEFLVRQAGRYLVDRPFLQILFFAPLSLFAGGGFSYLIMELRSRISTPKSGSVMISMGLVALAVVAIMIRPLSDFKPNPCCVYMRIDDIFLIGWIKENVPKNSRILISTDMDFNTKSVKVGTDAGAWITPLTKLKTIKLDYRTDFSDPAFHNALCQENIKYIYVSAVNTSFSIILIEDNKKNYSPIIVLPEARLYSVNCPLSLPVNMMAMSSPD